MNEPGDDEQATATVRRKAALMAQGRRGPSTFWRSLAHIGVLGWLFVIPLVAFALLGHFIADRLSEPAFGLGGLLLGLVISIYVTGRAVQRAMDEVGEDRSLATREEPAKPAGSEETP